MCYFQWKSWPVIQRTQATEYRCDPRRSKWRPISGYVYFNEQFALWSTQTYKRPPICRVSNIPRDEGWMGGATPHITGCLKWNPPFWDEYYSSIVQLGQKIKLNPSMGQKQYLKSCFRIRIFWKLCPVGGSDYQNLVKNWRMFLNLSPT